MIITSTIWLLLISTWFYSGFSRVNLSLSLIFILLGVLWASGSVVWYLLLIWGNICAYPFLLLILPLHRCCECVCVCTQSYMILCNPVDYSPQAHLSTEFSRQEYRSGLPVHPPGYLPHRGIKPTSPSLAGGVFTTDPPGKHVCYAFSNCPVGSNISFLYLSFSLHSLFLSAFQF